MIKTRNEFFNLCILERIVNVTRELEEERRKSEEKTNQINELTAKLVQYEEYQTLFGALVTNTGIPDDSFPKEILTQPVELRMFPHQSFDDDSGEWNDDAEEIMEMDGEGASEESGLTGLVVQPFEGVEMEEMRDQPVVKKKRPRVVENCINYSEVDVDFPNESEVREMELKEDEKKEEEPEKEDDESSKKCELFTAVLEVCKGEKTVESVMQHVDTMTKGMTEKEISR
ncbi:hypothetical protein PMAYCL1PPCAC_19612, partial [Pristionchus mayeri]